MDSTASAPTPARRRKPSRGHLGPRRLRQRRRLHRHRHARPPVAQIARHGIFDITCKATGDLHIDTHHTVEDVGIALGRALPTRSATRSGIVRMGDALVPLDEALAQVAIDLSGRGYAVLNVSWSRQRIGELPCDLDRALLAVDGPRGQLQPARPRPRRRQRPPQGRVHDEGAGPRPLRRHALDERRAGQHAEHEGSHRVARVIQSHGNCSGDLQVATSVPCGATRSVPVFEQLPMAT